MKMSIMADQLPRIQVIDFFPCFLVSLGIPLTYINLQMIYMLLAKGKKEMN